MQIIIYSTPSCPYCHLAKKFLEEEGFKYIEYNVADDEEKREEMFKKSKQMGVPVIDINGEIVIGFDKPRLMELLKIKQ